MSRQPDNARFVGHIIPESPLKIVEQAQPFKICCDKCAVAVSVNGVAMKSYATYTHVKAPKGQKMPPIHLCTACNIVYQGQYFTSGYRRQSYNKIEI